MVSILASRLGCLEFNSKSSPNFRAKIVSVAEFNQWRCLEESGQWLENVNRTHLVLACGKIVLQKNALYPSGLSCKSSRWTATQLDVQSLGKFWSIISSLLATAARSPRVLVTSLGTTWCGRRKPTTMSKERLLHDEVNRQIGQCQQEHLFAKSLLNTTF